MATSSITHNFIVSDSKRFAEALEVAEQEAVSRAPHKPVQVHNITDASEIRSFWNVKIVHFY